MINAVISIFALAGVAPLIQRFAGRRAGLLVALLPACLTVYFASYAGVMMRGESVTQRFAWAASLGVEVKFYLDGLSLLMTLLICGIGSLVCVYGGGYLRKHEHLGRFYLFLLAFMGAMLGLVLAGNLLVLFVFWELTSITSFLLIGFEHEDEGARAAALQALIITAGGGLLMLAGFVMLGQVAGGNYDVQALLAQGDAIKASSLYVPLLLLIFVGAFTKSAQFPFHFWLPNAMQAPTPISAYLHSATMVKAGVYLLARLAPALGGSVEWTSIMTTTGALTMIVGSVLAFYQTNMKRLLAYSTIAALGTMVMLIGTGSEYAIRAALVFLLAHALYKGALFMIAGIIDHQTGTKDVEVLGGLRKAMPLTATIAVVAGLSLAAIPPMFSFISKEMLFEATLDVDSNAGRFRLILTAVAVLAGTMFVTVAGLVAVRPFFGSLKVTPKVAHDAPLEMWFAPALLAVAGIVFGCMPNTVTDRLIAPAVAAVYPNAAPMELALWHGLNVPLGLSVVSIVCGLVLYRAWDALRTRTKWTQGFSRFGTEGMFAAGGELIECLARWQTAILQNGKLRIYLLVITGTTIGLTAYTMRRGGITFPAANFFRTDVKFYEVGLALLILAASVAAVRSKSRLGAVAALGVVGYGVALVFILFGAPDLALTQFLIETLTVILLVLVLYHLPRLKAITGKRARARDLIVSLLFGALMTTLVLITASVEFDPRVSDFYAAHSLPDAHGRNIVNVILVDFRGLDTLGEITVLAVAAIGVFALLKLRPQAIKQRAKRKRRQLKPLKTTTRGEESPL
ncbi:MAG: putative monovalent cation/H+ antiporter subunit A [Pyrinomonadaceae bacterium MAG19_C2-C3]|nr:putative monovalent cation/H+ antiporter subunit A [Pyrinomonadaceae bacterium MAG19_C2-C3]